LWSNVNKHIKYYIYKSIWMKWIGIIYIWFFGCAFMFVSISSFIMYEMKFTSCIGFIKKFIFYSILLLTMHKMHDSIYHKWKLGSSIPKYTNNKLTLMFQEKFIIFEKFNIISNNIPKVFFINNIFLLAILDKFM